MSGGQKIDYHGSPFGNQWPLPKGAHAKNYSSAEGDGHLPTYEDTTEAIHSVQELGAKKSRNHAQRPGYRY